jgi:Ca2+-transporting ATPase
VSATPLSERPLAASNSPYTVEPQGLTSQEAAVRLAALGPNVIVPNQRPEGLKRWLRMMADPMVVLLLLAAIVYAALGEMTDAIVMSVALVPILAVDVLLEGRAERTLDKLRKLTEPKVTALRDSVWIVLPVELLVPGDVIRVQEGDVLPADCTLLAGSDVIADESALTGESVPVSKQAGGDVQLLAGTVLLSGRGTGEVTATGGRTDYGKIGALVASVKPGPTPLQQSISGLVRRLFVGAIGICAAVVVLGLVRGLGTQESFLGGISLAIAAIPEEFPVVYALYLTLGVWRLAGHHALVRRMVGVETLGSTTVICTDKTGTLTFGRMELTDTWTPKGDPAAEQRLLKMAALASEPNPFDPLEQAIVARAPEAQSSGELVYEYPFDPNDKYMSHIWRGLDGRLQLCAKGALEGVLARCAAANLLAGAVTSANEALAERGIRVLAVARRELEVVSGNRVEDEAGLEFVGLIGLTDPLRPEVRAAIAECRAAGIRVLMLTGDHAATARAIAREAGISDAPLVLSASVLDDPDDAVVGRAVNSADAFARIRPAEKLELVQQLRSQGHTVAMTGDGINDGPALRAADIGVAMGQRGTEVAREAATMVLLDDNFGTIIAAIREGRRILVNVRRAFGYLVAFHIPILLAAIAAPLAGLPLLLEPVHLVWLELVVHPISSLAFEGDEAPSEVMRQPPRRRDAPLISNGRLLLSVLSGLGAFLGVWLGYVWAGAHGWPEPLARNLAFTALILSQIGLVLAERSEGRLRRSGRVNRHVPMLLSLAAASTLLPYIPGAPGLLHLAPLDLRQWLLAGGLAVGIGLWAEAVQLGGALFGRRRAVVARRRPEASENGNQARHSLD